MPDRTDNAELIRLGYEAMNRGDFESAAESIHPEVEWLDPPEMPDAGTVRGIEALKEVWAGYFEQFDEVRFETDEIVDRGDVVFHAIRLSGTGRTSRARVEMTWYQVSRIGPDGLTRRLENFLDREQARRAAGIGD